MTGKLGVSCFGCQTRHTTEWCASSDAELTLLDQVKAPKIMEAGTALFHQGDECGGIYCLNSGLVGIRRLDAAGNSTLLRLAGPGETIGYQSFLLGTAHRATAEIMMPSTVCFIRRQTVRGLLEQNPNLGLRFLRHNVKDAAEFEERHFETISFTVRSRFLNLLMVLYERFGSLNEDGEPVLDLPLSRQDIAALIGSTPETVSRSISKVQDEGLARFKGRKVLLQDIDELMRQLPAS
ncbi:MAG: Crp/Fnr family transcriptional regulator [Alphaproteobacteria bacterium]|nr:Crp/Fnr family transcriptional regulator [Alphaproteobacteria bacterium]